MQRRTSFHLSARMLVAFCPIGVRLRAVPRAAQHLAVRQEPGGDARVDRPRGPQEPGGLPFYFKP